MPAIRIKQRIAFSLETRLARRRPQQKTRVLQPLPQVLFLALPLRMSEARNRRNPMLDQRCMSHKHHIRRAFARMQHPNISNALKLLIQILPLPKGGIARWMMKITRPPRVDDVINVVPLRWTHQISGTIEMG